MGLYNSMLRYNGCGKRRLQQLQLRRAEDKRKRLARIEQIICIKWDCLPRLSFVQPYITELFIPVLEKIILEYFFIGCKICFRLLDQRKYQIFVRKCHYCHLEICTKCDNNLSFTHDGCEKCQQAKGIYRVPLEYI